VPIAQGSLVVTFVAAAFASVAGASAGSTVVTTTGKIGPLHLDRSDRAAVIAFAGAPDAESHGSDANRPPYDALGYNCGAGASGFPFVKGVPKCRTVFFVDVRSGKLEEFFTFEPRYVERHGVRIGTSSAKAERVLHRRLYYGCDQAIRLSSRTGLLSVLFAGGIEHRPNNHVIGAHVEAFVLHSRLRGSGVFDCV
jgi:hypothetical protein